MLKNRFSVACVVFALFQFAQVAQAQMDPGGDPPPIGIGILPPPEGQVGNPSVMLGNPIKLHNRGKVITDPFSLDGALIDMTVSIPSGETLDNGEVYNDFLEIILGATGGLGSQPNRPWGVVEPGTVVIRVFRGGIQVYLVVPGATEEDPPQEVHLGGGAINTADGNLPLDLLIQEDEGALVITTGGPAGAGGDPITVLLPPGINYWGNLIAYNRELVAGVSFDAEITLDVEAPNGAGGGNNLPPPPGGGAGDPPPGNGGGGISDPMSTPIP